MVGIWNSGQTRHPDYFPKKPFADLSQVEKDTISAQLQRAGKIKGALIPQSDNYLKFIVKELKPYIDKKYSVNTSRKGTFIAGSSMGGMISIYAICEYPKVFGGAACLSTHWTGSYTLVNNPFPGSMISYLDSHLPNPNKHKIYFDYGDQTLDSLYPSIQRKVDVLMIKKGYNENNWVTHFFPGDDHSEKAWNNRLHIPLEFLFKKNSLF